MVFVLMCHTCSNSCVFLFFSQPSCVCFFSYTSVKVCENELCSVPQWRRLLTVCCVVLYVLLCCSMACVHKMYLTHFLMWHPVASSCCGVFRHPVSACCNGMKLVVMEAGFDLSAAINFTTRLRRLCFFMPVYPPARRSLYMFGITMPKCC